MTLAATPPTVAPGGATTLAGTLTGTNNANREVVLQSNAFPYTPGFANVGNPLVTDAAGNFSFPVLSVPVTTQFRVLMPHGPRSPARSWWSARRVQVRTATKKVKRDRHSVSVRFSGDIRPAADGARVDIQKLRNGVWTTIAHTRAKHASCDALAPTGRACGCSAAVSSASWPRRPARWSPAPAGRSTSRSAGRSGAAGYPATVRAACSRKRAA